MLRSTSGAHSIAHENQINPENKIIKVPMVKLDNIIKELNLDIINFVKIDVEGYELEVLKGAKNALNKIKFFSIGSYHSPNQKFEISKFLENKNFKVINDGDKTYAWNKKFPFTN